MAIRIPWDEYEAAILLDACLAVLDNKISRADAVLKVSRILREKAVRNGIVIDPVYRNENGISMQMSTMMALILETSSSLHGASKQFIDIVHLYKNNPAQFQKVLEEAKKDGVEARSIKVNFYKWLEHSVRPSDVSYIKKACDLIDTYSKNGTKLGYSLFETNQLADVQKIMKVIEKDVFFRAKNERKIKKIEKALKEYYRFMRENISNETETLMSGEEKNDEINICDAGANVSRISVDTHEEEFSNVDFDRYKIILSKDYKKDFGLMIS